MSNDSLEAAVAALLREAPDGWQEIPQDNADALRALTAAGLIERQIVFGVRMPGQDDTHQIEIEVTGEGGLAAAFQAVIQDWWARWGVKWQELRQTINEPVTPIVVKVQDKWRITDQGRLAREDLERGERTPIDFTLKRGFFMDREAVYGSGRLVKVENAPSGPLAIKVTNWDEGAKAFAEIWAAKDKGDESRTPQSPFLKEWVADIAKATAVVVGKKDVVGVSRLMDIAKSKETVDRRLYLMGKTGLLRADVSASELAALLNCSDTAVKRTRWWKTRMAQRRQGKADAEAHYHRKYRR